MTTPEGYIITCNSYMGDSEDLILNMTITFLDGTKKTESRYTKANKKGIARTSIYGIKCKVNINTLHLIKHTLILKL